MTWRSPSADDGSGDASDDSDDDDDDDDDHHGDDATMYLMTGVTNRYLVKTLPFVDKDRVAFWGWVSHL